MDYKALVEAGGFDKPAKEVALDLIFESTGVRLPPHVVTLGVPRTLDQRPDVLTDEDTYVPAEIDEAYDDRFPGDNGFMYRRVGFDALEELVTVPTVLPAAPYRIHDALQAISAAMRLKLTIDDLENDLVAPGAPLVVRATKTSLVWTGEVTLTVSAPEEPVDPPDPTFPPDLFVLPVLVLDGLYLEPV